MQKIRGMFLFLLLFTFPVHEVCAQVRANSVHNNSSISSIHQLRDAKGSDILKLFDEIETGAFERRCNNSQLKEMSNLIASLAERGVSEDTFMEDFQSDLLAVKSLGSFSPHELNNGKLYCVSLFKKGRLKDFFKKYKKEIIIGAVIIVAASVMVVMAVSAASATAAAASAACATTTQLTEPPKKTELLENINSGIEQNTFTHEESAQEVAVKDASFPSYSVGINEQPPEQIAPEQLNFQFGNPFQNSYTFTASNEPLQKEVEKAELSLFEKFLEISDTIKRVEGGFQHEVFDEIASFPKLGLHLVDAINIKIWKMLVEDPDSLVMNEEISLAANYEILVNKVHEFLDEIYGTDFAYQYTAEYQANDPMNEIQLGMIPFPSFGAKITNRQLLCSANRIDRAGFTKVGRSLVKKSYRDNSMYKRAVGRPAEINARAEKILESILEYPNRKLDVGSVKWNGKVVDIYSEGLGGARFTLEGEFITLLELTK